MTAVRIGFQATGSQVRVTAMSIKDYLSIAYGIRPQQIEGPDWIGQQRFDVSRPRFPTACRGRQVPEMLQTLLADRFQMKLHRETKDLPVYVLGVVEEPAPSSPSR